MSVAFARIRAAGDNLSLLSRRVLSPCNTCAGWLLTGRRHRSWRPLHERRRRTLAEDEIAMGMTLEKRGEKRREGKAVKVVKKELEASSAADLLSEDSQDRQTHLWSSPFQAARLVEAFAADRTPNNGVSVRLRVDVDLSRESVRGVSHLPHSIGKQMRLVVFCPDADVAVALAAGADHAGLDEMVEKISKGWLEFDHCIATPPVMPKLMKVARILGPLRLMPNTKSGTVVTNIHEAVQSAKAGSQVEFRAQGEGDITAQIGNAAQTPEVVLENLRTLVRDVLRAQPRGQGGQSAATTGLSFQWPPPRRKVLSPSLLPGMAGFRGSSAAKTSSAVGFVKWGVLFASDTPSIQIDGAQLHPSSGGYYR